MTDTLTGKTHPPSSENQLAVIKSPVQPRLYTLGEYLQREARSSERHEYFNGQILRVPTAHIPHNTIIANTVTAIKIAVKSLPQTYRVLSGQQKVYLPQLNFALYPDVLVVCETPVSWGDNDELLVNPLLIVEVLSKSTKKYDRGEKFSAYKTLDSFREYVLIDPTQCRVESRFREEPDLWRDTIITELVETFPLRSLGCGISMADIYEYIQFEAPKGRKK